MNEFELSIIAFLHLERGLSQQDIAARLGLSKMTVSRMLQKAKESKIIQIEIGLPFQLDKALAEQIEVRYGIEKAIVVKKGGMERQHVSELIGRVCAFYIGLSLSDGDILGLGVGNTIGQVIRNLVPMKVKNVRIVQLMGGLADVTYKNPFTIVQETCRKLNAEGTLLTSFATVENEEIRNSIIYNTPMGVQIRNKWGKCSEAILGIGTIERGTLLSPTLITTEETEKLKQLGAVGDILGHCFDRNGTFITSDLEKKLVSIPVDMLKRIPQRLAVAGGEEKARAIRGALLSGIITTLMTDDKTAAVLLKDRES
jgi:DNA-binding transcriptional regulator LsrR (DeoR family)